MGVLPINHIKSSDITSKLSPQTTGTSPKKYHWQLRNLQDSIFIFTHFPTCATRHSTDHRKGLLHSHMGRCHGRNSHRHCMLRPSSLRHCDGIRRRVCPIRCSHRLTRLAPGRNGQLSPQAPCWSELWGAGQHPRERGAWYRPRVAREDFGTGGANG